MKMLLLLLFICMPAYINAGSFLGCPVECTCNDHTFVVQCQQSRLDIIPITLNPAIQRLVLKNNKIKTVDAAIQFYRELQYVDLSSNHLVHIPAKTFLYQEKLQELHLNKNKLSTVTNKTFEGLKSLTVLNLRENFLEELSNGIFSLLPKLEELNLGQNRLSKIDASAFNGLLNLRILYLDDNLLSSVPAASFSVMGSLAELHVGFNAFYSLPDDSFKDLSKLLVLDISSGGIANISQHAFKGLTGLRNLNIADNRLQQIPTAQLRYLVRLEELTIGQNDFVSMQKGAFKGLANLKRLDVTGANNLERIGKSAFSDNMNLEMIALVSNRNLKTLEEGAFVGLPNLKHMVLRDNAIRTLSEMVVPWSELRVLEISGNSLNCDCRLLWMLNLAKFRNLTDLNCVTPIELRDKSLKSLTSEDLGCSFGDASQRVIVVTFCISATILLAVLSLFFFKYRLKIRNALRDNTFSKDPISEKEHEYHMTFSEDEYTICTCQMTIKHIPVTEL